MATNDSCVLCQGGRESHLHIFWSCNFTSRGWRCFLALMKKIGVSGQPSQLVYESDSEWRARLRLILIWSWFIWFERNSRVFSDKRSSFFELASSAVNFCSLCSPS
ncbi:hypothetical protein Cni_G26586 [Canna indica]|uniref:Reverse transcriptase zinc-binding domain-containing protein n=1 Tax=Canna indica TaxID=4628 RepID=A0AAQ3KZA5_9LILI|nr:hypothetical protein Cni_G26586 [Canna indica]